MTIYEAIKEKEDLIAENRKMFRKEKMLIKEVTEALKKPCIFETMETITKAGKEIASLEKAKTKNAKRMNKITEILKTTKAA